MKPESVHILMLAAARYASSRSSEDRAVMLSVGSEFWQDFPAFLLQMKEAIQSGRSRDFLEQGDAKHMYALMFVSILNGLDSAYVNKVGGALFAAASAPRPASAKGCGEQTETRVRWRRPDNPALHRA